jgi:hypothetical protein
MTYDMSYSSQSRCPLCGSWERTQPVPAIVAAQSTVTTTYGSAVGAAFARGRVVPVFMGTRSSGFGSTPLATALSFQVPQPSKAISRWGWFLTVFGIAWAYFIGYGAATDFGAAPGSGTPAWARIFVFIAFGASVPAFGVALLITARAQRRRARERAPLEAMAARVWSNARYCAGDHIVYLPDGAYTHPGGISGLVYAAAQRALAAGAANAGRG